jgi:hypothetical protein
MPKKRKMTARLSAAILAVALTTLGFAGSASAYSGEWSAFNNCPVSNPQAWKCLKSVTNGGSVKLGKKTVPIVNPVTLEGGVTEESLEESEFGISRMVAAKNGQTLSKTPQPVPGGLAGLVNCKEIGSWIVRVACESVFENGLTGVNAVLELAKPASDIKISQQNLVFEEGVALQLPVKVRLENPFLGSGCYVGSASTPLIWNLTTGKSSPPPPTAPISGSGGELSFTEEAQILHLKGSKLVDNGWSAPKASGCGGFGVELILNPIIDLSVGLPAAAGVNVSQLESVNTDVALSTEVVKHP